jgi:hypothetical protein
MTPQVFLETFAEMAKTASVNKTLDFMFDTIDDWLLEGEQEKAEQVLDEIDVNKYRYDYLVGFLVITLVWPLKNRPKFARLVEERIRREEPERVDKILQGLI